MKNAQVNFAWKIIRNGFILAGSFFFALWSTQDVNWLTFKPVLVFFGTYVFAELANYLRIPAKRGELKTLIL